MQMLHACAVHLANLACHSKCIIALLLCDTQGKFTLAVRQLLTSLEAARQVVRDITVKEPAWLLLKGYLSKLVCNDRPAALRCSTTLISSMPWYVTCQGNPLQTAA